MTNGFRKFSRFPTSAPSVKKGLFDDLSADFVKKTADKPTLFTQRSFLYCLKKTLCEGVAHWATPFFM